MNASTVIPAGTDLVLAVTDNPALALTSSDAFEALFSSLKDEAATLDADVSSKKNRDTIRSFASKVRSRKAGIDKDRLRLTKEARDMIASINAQGKEIEERLEALAVEARRPLTEWEDAEKARVEECQAIISQLAEAGTVTLEDTAATVRARGTLVYETKIDADRFGDLYERAEGAKAHTISLLRTALERLTKEEADRAELERLRAENEARLAREAEEAAAREAQERAARDAREAEERRIAAEKAEAERIERAKQEAVEAERQRVQREHEEALAAERRRAEEAERAAQAERDRIAKEEAARKAEAERVAAEQRRREADKAHRTAIKSAAKTAIMSCGADEETARKIVVAIIAGEVPAVKLEF